MKIEFERITLEHKNGLLVVYPNGKPQSFVVVSNKQFDSWLVRQYRQNVFNIEVKNENS